MSAGLCVHCGKSPKFADSTRVHPYCGRTCAVASKVSAVGAIRSQPTIGSTLCLGCNTFPKFYDTKRSIQHDYCSKTCAKIAKQINGGRKFTKNVCLMCRSWPITGKHPFCSKTCATNAQRLSPAILEVPAGDDVFNSVADQHKASWRHTNKILPNVRYVYKIIASQASINRYEAYRAQVEARGQFIAKGRSEGNENRRWHGTNRQCTLGENGNTSFCSSASCSLCSIIQSSFDLSRFKARTGWGRFGSGIYTSSTSSKSDDYSYNAGSSLKAVLLNKVVVGKGYKLKTDDPSLTAPPAGYDSVLAEPGSSLNHDELVVYTNDAIVPSYLVIYDP